MKSIIVGLFFSLFCSIAYADRYPDLDKYYPLTVGNEWVYSSPVLGIQQRRVISYEDELKGYALLIKSRMAGEYLEIIQKLGDRVEKIGGIGQDGDYKQSIPSQTKMIAPLKKGNKWEYNDGDTHKHLFKVIGFVNMTVKAGKFTKVLKIERYIMNTDDRSKDWGKSYLYYAPNVGFIKEEFPAKNGKIEVIAELVDYKIVGNE